MNCDDVAIQLWTDRLQDSSRVLRVFERFYDEVLVDNERLHLCMRKYGLDGTLSPSSLIEFQSRAVARDRYLIGDLARQWINRHPWTLNTKQARLSQIGSPFLHNHAPLPMDRGFHFTNCKEPVMGDLHKDDLVAIIHDSNPTYACIFIFLAQTFLDTARFCYVNTHHAAQIVEAVTKREGIIKIALPPRKNNPEPAFTMVDTATSDFATCFHAYLRETRHDVTEVLFLNEQGHPVTRQNISQYFHRRVLRLSSVSRLTPPCQECGAKTVKVRPIINRKQHTVYDCTNSSCHFRLLATDVSLEWQRKIHAQRTGKHVHEIRDLMKSRFIAGGGKETAVDFFMVHTIDPNEYKKLKYMPGYAEREYRKALKWLNILSMDPEKISRSQLDADLAAQNAKVEVLSREVASLRKRQQVFEHPLFVQWLEEKMHELEAEQE